MDRERSGSLLNRYQPQQNVLPYKEDLTIQKMLHAKCDVVKLVRDQMNRIDDSTVNKELQDCLKFVNSHLRLLHKKSHFFRTKTFTGRMWKYRYHILLLILALILMWLLFVYGAMLGATFCGGIVKNQRCSGWTGLGPILFSNKQAMSVY